MTVTPETAAGSFEHGGTTYYFCSAGCLAKFRADPARFLAPGARTEAMAPPAPNAGATDVEYTCPMHPEIVQIGPGSCPICGMASRARCHAG
jgi:Cu+-exporting ATPase